MSSNYYSEKDRVLLIRIDEQLNQLNTRVGTVEKDMKELRGQANRWKGAVFAVLAFSSLIGWVITQFEKIKQLFS